MGETLWLDSLGVIIRQYSLKLESGKRYIVDGFDFRTNTVYEYNGDYWHGNPNFYNGDDKNCFGVKFKDLYKKKLRKKKKI